MLARVASILTHPTGLRLVALAAAIGWTVAFPISLATQRGLFKSPGQPFGGDFIAFYAAGRLVLEGRGAELYDLRAQQTMQAELLRAPEYHGLIAYPNPPVLAAVFAPLAGLPYMAAYVTCTLGLLAAFLGAMHLLRPHLPRLAPHWGTALGLAWLLYPISRSVTAGQNTVVTLLLLALAYSALRREQPLRAGLALGLLLYKPQMVVLLGLLLLVRRQFRCLAMIALVGVGQYLLGAAICGVWWPADMLRMCARYWPLENEHNGATAVALVGFCEYWAPGGTGKTIGLLAAGALLLAILWEWRGAQPRSPAFALHWGMAVSATLLVSPHTQWYDAGLVLLPILLALDYVRGLGRSLTPTVKLALLAAFAVFPLQEPLANLGWQPLPFVLLGTVLWLARVAGQRAPGHVATEFGYSSGT